MDICNTDRTDSAEWYQIPYVLIPTQSALKEDAAEGRVFPSVTEYQKATTTH